MQDCEWDSTRQIRRGKQIRQCEKIGRHGGKRVCQDVGTMGAYASQCEAHKMSHGMA